MDAEEDDLSGDDEGGSDLASADDDGTDKGDASKVVKEAPAPDEVDLVPVAEAGRIFLDKVSDVRWALTDIVTRDTHWLDGDDWRIDFHPSTGRGIVYKKEGGEDLDDIILDTVFPTQLYRRSDTQEVVWVKQKDGKECGRPDREAGRGQERPWAHTVPFAWRRFSLRYCQHKAPHTGGSALRSFHARRTC